MRISTNYLYSNPHAMHNTFGMKAPRKLASMAVLSAIAGMGIGTLNEFESEESEDDYNNIGLYTKSNLDSPKVQRFIDELI